MPKKKNAKGIPSDVNQYIDQVMEPGSDPYTSSSHNINNLTGQKTDKRKIYKADGIIRLETYMDLEVLILETASDFSHGNYPKTAFDNSKDTFALLSMLKTIADQYKHASVEEFKKKILQSEDFSNREEQIVSLVIFFLNLKNFLEEITNTIAALKGQHEENEKY
ncbi:hypothetical protein BCV71DRAFT_236337 [Rhizopus microsporus]|uniref:Uncharacterized protein n=1 Tax=Rhizopus microsporus TaxID=58291 RepID=A0A1X0RY75_RHIZD|nr:hypothetical protein BCV71DRAFT_236337 [Rhizopus microsporus]